MEKVTPKKLLEKIVVNIGTGKLSQLANFSDKVLPQIIKDLSAVTGQHPVQRPAKKSIAGFKLRQGTIVGLQITLRGQKMVDFFERLITIVLPRVHDFKGLKTNSVDAHGTLSIGFREQVVFPEISAEESQYTFPFGVNIVPKNGKKEEIVAAYKELGVPFAKGEEVVFKKRKKNNRKK